MSTNSFCEICNVQLITENDWKTHFTGKRHKKNEGFFKSMQNNSEKTVYVSSLPRGIIEMQLSDYFGQYGNVSKINLDKKSSHFAFVQFANKDTQQFVLKAKRHCINGKLIKVSETRQRSWKPTGFNPQNNSAEKLHQFETNHPILLSKLQKSKSVKDQMLDLQWLATLTMEEMKERHSFCQNMEKILKDFFPSCKLFIYGSTASGYGFKGCDIDFSINLPEKQVKIERTPLDIAPSLMDVQRGKVSHEDLMNLPKEVMLRFLKKLIKNVVHCAMIMVIPSVRCPILRFVQRKMGISVDMSFDKRIGIENTKLLKHYGRLDVRVRPLIITLRYWAKLKGLLGSGHKFTSYAFTWMVIFYLQTREPPVLPSVDILQNLSENEKQVDGCNVAFCEDFSRIPKSKNQESIVNLLKGFFNFYYSFDFTMNALCPKNGSIVDRGLLKEQLLLQKEFKLSAITLQDPIEISRNITLNLNHASVVEFIEKLEEAQTICQSEQFENFSEDITEDRGICRILQTSDTSNSPRKSLKRKAEEMQQNHFCTLQITDKMVECLRSQKNFQVLTPDEIENQMIEKSCQTLLSIFQEGLLMECCVLENAESKDLENDDSPKSSDETACKMQRTDGNKTNEENISKSIPVMKISCSVYYKTWNGRKKKKIDESTISTPLECENIISSELIREQQQEKPKKPYFDFEVHLFKQKKGAVNILQIELVSVTKCKEFNKCVAVFLVGYIPKVAEACLTHTCS